MGGGRALAVRIGLSVALFMVALAPQCAAAANIARVDIVGNVASGKTGPRAPSRRSPAPRSTRTTSTGHPRHLRDGLLRRCGRTPGGGGMVGHVPRPTPARPRRLIEGTEEGRRRRWSRRSASARTPFSIPPGPPGHRSREEALRREGLPRRDDRLHDGAGRRERGRRQVRHQGRRPRPHRRDRLRGQRGVQRPRAQRHHADEGEVALLVRHRSRQPEQGRAQGRRRAPDGVVLRPRLRDGADLGAEDPP